MSITVGTDRYDILQTAIPDVSMATSDVCVYEALTAGQLTTLKALAAENNWALEIDGVSYAARLTAYLSTAQRLHPIQDVDLRLVKPRLQEVHIIKRGLKRAVYHVAAADTARDVFGDVVPAVGSTWLSDPPAETDVVVVAFEYSTRMGVSGPIGKRAAPVYYATDGSEYLRLPGTDVAEEYGLTAAFKTGTARRSVAADRVKALATVAISTYAIGMAMNGTPVVDVTDPAAMETYITDQLSAILVAAGTASGVADPLSAYIQQNHSALLDGIQDSVDTTPDATFPWLTVTVNDNGADVVARTAIHEELLPPDVDAEGWVI